MYEVSFTFRHLYPRSKDLTPPVTHLAIDLQLGAGYAPSCKPPLGPRQYRGHLHWGKVVRHWSWPLTEMSEWCSPPIWVHGVTFVFASDYKLGHPWAETCQTDEHSTTFHLQMAERCRTMPTVTRGPQYTLSDLSTTLPDGICRNSSTVEKTSARDLTAGTDTDSSQKTRRLTSQSKATLFKHDLSAVRYGRISRWLKMTFWLSSICRHSESESENVNSKTPCKSSGRKMLSSKTSWIVSWDSLMRLQTESLPKRNNVPDVLQT